MNLHLNTISIENYSSKSQIAKNLTEDWVRVNSYCPCCGNQFLNKFENNLPVADFFCYNCEEEFELKSKNAAFSRIINDGAYRTMIERVNSNNNPNFFFLTYLINPDNWIVNNFVLIPNHYFTTDIIIERPPLSNTAKRAGWVGCKIDISNIPESGKIFLVKNGKIFDKQDVIGAYLKTKSLKSIAVESRGWIMDVLNCIDKIKSDNFSIEDVYRFEDELKQKHPDNKNIKAKIRQQLQNLRDKGIVEFSARGKYRKI